MASETVRETIGDGQPCEIAASATVARKATRKKTAKKK